MPDLSRFTIKLSLAYLAGALLIGLALAAPGQLEDEQNDQQADGHAERESDDADGAEAFVLQTRS